MLHRATLTGLAALVAACGLDSEGTAPSGTTTASATGTSSTSSSTGSTSTSTSTSVASSGTSQSAVGTGGGTAEGGATSAGGADGGATSAGGAGGATGGGGSGGEGGVQYPPEGDCLNGDDDNGDGRTDCADPSCTEVACVPEIAGALYYVTLSAAPCVVPSIEHDELICGDCLCNDDPGTCTVDWTAKVTDTCSGPPEDSGTACEDVADGNRFVSATMTHDANHACIGPDTPLAGTRVEACEIEVPGECANPQERCVPDQGTHCVALPPETADCPASYPDRHEAEYEWNDTGLCDCTCAGEAPSCQGGEILVSTGSDTCPVSASAPSFPADGSCNPITSVDAIDVVPATAAQICTATVVPQTAPAAVVLCCE